MPLMSSRIPLTGQEPEGWRLLWEKAQREGHPKKLDAIIKQMNRLLSAYERRARPVQNQSTSS
jgi:hypothetical protein